MVDDSLGKVVEERSEIVEVHPHLVERQGMSKLVEHRMKWIGTDFVGWQNQAVCLGVVDRSCSSSWPMFFGSPGLALLQSTVGRDAVARAGPRRRRDLVRLCAPGLDQSRRWACELADGGSAGQRVIARRLGSPGKIFRRVSASRQGRGLGRYVPWTLICLRGGWARADSCDVNRAELGQKERRVERVQFETDRQRIVGDVTLPPEGYQSRFSDSLNRPDVSFIPLVNVEVSSLMGGDVEHLPFIVLCKSHVRIAFPIGPGQQRRD